MIPAITRIAESVEVANRHLKRLIQRKQSIYGGLIKTMIKYYFLTKCTALRGTDGRKALLDIQKYAWEKYGVTFEIDEMESD